MEALSATAHADQTGGASLFRPSRTAVIAMLAYLPLAFLATIVAGDLGDVGFWFVWIPVAAILLYLPVAGVAYAVRRRG